MQRQQPDSGRVIVVGSVNEDIVVRAPRLPAPGETLSGSSVRRGAGGKGANQAVAASRAGASTHLIACVGDDAAGRDQVDALVADGVSVDHVTVLPDSATGTAVVTVDDSAENQIVIVAGANDRLSADRVGSALTHLALLPGDVVLAGFEVSDEAVLAAARSARAAGARLLVNPAPARPLLDELLDAGPILLPNEGELADLTDQADPTLGARALAAATGAAVVVTLGADGALMIDASLLQKVVGIAVQAVDTTGAGDTFAGVLAARLAGGEPLALAVRVAVVAAALSVTAPGARGAMPRADAIDRALAGPGGLSHGTKAPA